MITLIVGGSGSGKSAYAEELLDDFSGKKFYLATMQVFDGEGQKKVDVHRRKRAGKGFVTIEQCRNIGEIRKKLESNEKQALLLECVSNLVANEMFTENGQQSADVVAEKVVSDIMSLADQLAEYVIVSNNVFEDGITYDEGTMEYLNALAQINVSLAERADQTVEVVVGIPVVQRSVV